MNKKVIIALVIAIVAFFVFMRMGKTPATTTTTETDITADSLTQELNGLNDVDLGSELQGIDANVEKL